jgi:putative membrane protein
MGAKHSARRACGVFALENSKGILMKTLTHPALATVAALALTLSPVLLAQQATTSMDQSDSSRSTNTPADQHADANGSSASQPGTLEKNDSKDGASETRDANPGTAATDSAAQSATKDPNATDNAITSSGMSSTGHESAKPLSDKQFIMMAAQGGMTEVDLGKVATENGSSSQVKGFGARMVKDHSMADDELKSIAEKKGVTLSSSLDAKHQAMVDKMSKLSGPAFDKAYINGMVRDHEKTVAMFKEESESGQDPEVKAFAAKTLPTLEDHLTSIEQLRSSGVK